MEAVRCIVTFRKGRYEIDARAPYWTVLKEVPIPTEIVTPVELMFGYRESNHYAVRFLSHYFLYICYDLYIKKKM